MSTQQRVRFDFAGRTLEGTVVASEPEPDVANITRTRLTVDVDGRTYHVFDEDADTL